MDIQSQILRFRTNKRKQDRSNPLGFIGFMIAAILSIAAAGGVIYGVNRYTAITEDLPSPEQMEILLNPPDGSLLEPTKIFDQAGQVELWRFENPAVDYRHYTNITDGEMLFFSDAPEFLILATLAAIDLDYFQKPESFLVGIWDTGPDPIPNSLVEELLLWREKDHPNRDLRIHLLADQIVTHYGREKILEWYINSAYFGNQIYGVSQAARFYFGKDLKSLDLAESALLAAVAKYPSLNPLDAPTAAKENQEVILEIMKTAGLITAAEADRSARIQLFYADPEINSSQIRPAYVDYILEEASHLIPQDRLLRGGFKIISTLDSELQKTLNCTLEVLLQRVTGEEQEIGTSCEASRLLPKYSGLPLADKESLEIDILLLDPNQGELRGMAGISDSGRALSFNKPRNPGTLITPYLYLTSFTRGFEPASLVWDIPLDGDEFSKEYLHPGCVDSCDYQGPVNIRTALVNDYLSPARQLWNTLGTNQYRNTMAIFGFSLGAEPCPDCTIFPESPALEMVDLAQGYGVFVNQGYLRGKADGTSNLEIQPAAVLRIEAHSGEPLMFENTVVEKKIISEELAYLLNHILSDEVARTESSNADVFQIGRTAGVKVGTVPGSDSGWVIGYTQQIVTAVWAGSPDGEDLDVDTFQVTSGLWRAITQYTSRNQTSEDWDSPQGIVTLDVCYPSGMLPTEYCPRIVREVFIQGNEPQGVDTLFQAIQVNRETGLLASVFTTSPQIEERVYLNVPAEAKEWAEKAGIDIPPTLYDLENLDQTREDFTFVSPNNFSFVNGQVRITGTIPEHEFVSARLQSGVGMNPRSWIQIGAEITSPGDNRRLGIWDTTELNDGIYALQLVVIKERQQIEKVSLIVSVDNTPPEMALKTDLLESDIPYLAGKEILFEVDFENSSEIQQVDFYLNEDLLATRRVPPYIHAWPLTLGEFELIVVATDQANNQTELSTSFEVIRE